MGVEQPGAGKEAPSSNGRVGVLQVMRLAKRVGIALAGGIVIFIGVILAMPLVPGPGLAIIVLGVAILALEFEKPRIWLQRLKAKGVELKARIKARRSPKRDD